MRRFIRDREANEFARLGEEILRKTFTRYGEELTAEVVQPVVAKQQLKDPLELFSLIGRGRLDPQEVLSVVAPRAIRKRRGGRGIIIPFRRNPFRAKTKDDPIAIKGLIPGMAVQLASCCTPLPGDRIVGLINEGKGVAVHTIDCEVLESFSSTPERWLDITWDSARSEQDTHVGRISAILNNVPGSLNALTEVIARVEGNISNLKVTNRSTDFFEFVVDVEVRSVQHLTQIIAALRAHPAIYQVERVSA